MTLTPELQYALRPFRMQLLRQQERIDRLERSLRASQLEFSSIEGDNLTVNDTDGNPQLSVGLQSDGSFAVASPVSTVPPSPSTPVVSAGILGLYASWDGFMSDGTLPLSDFASIQVHCSATQNFTPGTATLIGTMNAASQVFGIGGLLAGTTYYVAFVAATASGQLGAPSAQTAGVPQSVPANIPPGAITGTQVATGTLTGGNIAAATITGGNIAAGTIAAGNIAANTITATQLAAGIIYATIVDGTTITGANFVATGTTGQILVYSGTPAAGNLLISVSGQAGTDSFGNPYSQGVGVHGAAAFFTLPSLDAAETSPGVLGTGMFGTAGHRQLELELSTGSLSSNSTSQLIFFSASQDGTIPASATMFQPLTVAGALTFGLGGTPAQMTSDASGWPVMSDVFGLNLQVSGSKACNPGVGGTYPVAVTNTAVNTSLGFMVVPASDIQGNGPAFLVDAAGLFSTGTSVTTATFTLYWGGVGAVVLAQIQIPGTILASASQLGWWVEAKVYWVSSSEAVTKFKVGWHTATGAAGSAIYFVIGDVTSLVTNVSKNLSLAFQWGAALAASSLTCLAFQAGRAA